MSGIEQRSIFWPNGTREYTIKQSRSNNFRPAAMPNAQAHRVSRLSRAKPLQRREACGRRAARSIYATALRQFDFDKYNWRRAPNHSSLSAPERCELPPNFATGRACTSVLIFLSHFADAAAAAIPLDKISFRLAPAESATYFAALMRKV
jgi:hypothetical protein